MFALTAEICSYLFVNVIIIRSRGKDVFHNWLNPQLEALHVIKRQTTQSLFCAWQHEVLSVELRIDKIEMTEFDTDIVRQECFPVNDDAEGF